MTGQSHWRNSGFAVLNTTYELRANTKERYIRFPSCQPRWKYWYFVSSSSKFIADKEGIAFAFS